MEQYLVISLICHDQAQASSQIANTISASGCNIINCRMSHFGDEFSATLHLSGSWDSIAKLENALPGLEEKLKLQIIARRVELPEQEDDLLPYSAQIVAMDSQGTLARLTDFFESQEVLIEAIDTETYETSQTHTRMVSLNLSLNIPARCHLATIRERFLLFCDDHNLDAVIEPVKG